MQPKSRGAGLLLVTPALALALSLSAGCQQWVPPPESPPHRGTTLTVACPDAATADLVRRLAPAWEGRQQGRVEARVGAAGGRADVRVIRPAELAALVKAGQVRPLPSGAKAPDAYEWRRLLPLYRDGLLAWDTEVYALPLAGEALVCVYRSDRLERPPASWVDYATAAESSAKGGPSLPPLPARDEDLDRLFWTAAASCARRGVPADEPGGEDQLAELFSFHCDQQTGAPRIAGPGFVQALRLLQRLQKSRPAGTAERPEEAFRDGKAVLCVCEASWLVPFQQAPGLRDRFGVCLIPGAARYYDAAGNEQVFKGSVNRVPYLGSGGWLAVVPKGAANAEAAVSFLQTVTGPAVSAQAAMEPRLGGGATRQDHLLRERWDAFDLDAARTQQLREAVDRWLSRHGIKNPAQVLRVPDQAERRRALVAELRKALLAKADAQASLEAAAAAWRKLDEKKGKDAARADYRISLGLLGK